MLVYHIVILCREYRTQQIIFKTLYIISCEQKVLINNIRRISFCISRSIPPVVNRFLETPVNIGSAVELQKTHRTVRKVQYLLNKNVKLNFWYIIMRRYPIKVKSIKLLKSMIRIQA